MAEYVEMIDKYLVTRNESGTPSYKWTERTGEIVRCRDCDYWNTSDTIGWSRLGNLTCQCKEWSTEFEGETPTKIYTRPDEFCSSGVKRGDANEGQRTQKADI